MTERPFSPASLAERWMCSAEKVRQMCRSGELEAFRYGKSFRIPHAAVMRFEGATAALTPASAIATPAPPRSSGRSMDSQFGWPQMMKRQTAAAYCDISVSAFEGEVLKGRLPAPVSFGGRDHWHKPALDAALAHLAGEADSTPWETEFWERVPDYRRKLRARHDDK